MKHETVQRLAEDLRWRVGLLVFSVVVAVGGACALWVVQDLRASGTRAAGKDAQALAYSVAQTLAHQLGRAVRLGIPLAELPGVPAYLDTALRRQPMLTHIAIEAADGAALHAVGKASAAAAGGGEVRVPIAGTGAVGHDAGAVRVGVDPRLGLQRQLMRANVLAVVLVVALASGAALAAAWGPGARLERQRRLLAGQLLQGAAAASAHAEGAAQGGYGLPALEQALAQGQAHVESERRAMQHYAHELLAMDFDGRMRAEIDRLVPGLVAAAEQEG